jgi:hypothetical protein
MIEPRLRIGSIDVGDACTTFTRSHKSAFQLLV